MPVKLVYEHDNPFDARALAFIYATYRENTILLAVVSELLEEVHSAISYSSIFSVKFSWISIYITVHWTKSASGFFVDIERIWFEMTWLKMLFKSSSTKTFKSVSQSSSSDRDKNQQ